MKEVNSNEPWDLREKLLTTGWEQGNMVCDAKFSTCDDKLVGIERKEVKDLMSSMGKRLARQLDALLEHYHFRILLIEGSWQHARGTIVGSRGTTWSWSTIWNYIRTWQDKGITIELTTSLDHTALRLNELYAYYQKPAHTGGLTKKMVGDDRLLAFPRGIGLKSAGKVLEHFGSLRAVAEASIDDIITVDDVGPKRATWIWHHFNRNG